MRFGRRHRWLMTTDDESGAFLHKGRRKERERICGVTFMEDIKNVCTFTSTESRGTTARITSLRPSTAAKERTCTSTPPRQLPLHTFTTDTNLSQTPEFKALMARLRREEEAKSYQRMVSSTHIAPETFSQRFPNAASGQQHLRRVSCGCRCMRPRN